MAAVEIVMLLVSQMGEAFEKTDFIWWRYYLNLRSRLLVDTSLPKELRNDQCVVDHETVVDLLELTFRWEWLG